MLWSRAQGLYGEILMEYVVKFIDKAHKLGWLENTMWSDYEPSALEDPK